MTFVDDGCQVTFISTTAQSSRGQSCRAWKKHVIFDEYSLPLSIYLWSICRDDMWNMGGWTITLHMNARAQKIFLQNLPLTHAGVSNVNECLIVSRFGGREGYTSAKWYLPYWIFHRNSSREKARQGTFGTSGHGERIKWRLILWETFDVWFQ